MNKYIKTIAISTILMSFIAMAPVLVNAQVNGADDVSTTPSVPVNNTTPTPAVNGSDDVSTPASTNVTSGTTVTPAINGSDDTNQPASNPSNPGNPGTGVGGGVTNTSGGSSSGSGFALVSSNASSTANFIAGGACDYLSDYLKLGGTNNPTQVNRLQAFLKNNENIDVDINGIFDNKTFEAVKTFQGKYLADVMAPWGVNTPTGQVWYTTKKKVNEIYCKSIVNLTPEQLAQIEAYRNSLTVGGINEASNPAGTNTSTSTEVGSNSNTPLTAATVNVSFTNKIWNFIKWLFGY
jgi:hypothetical protein